MRQISVTAVSVVCGPTASIEASVLSAWGVRTEVIGCDVATRYAARNRHVRILSRSAELVLNAAMAAWNEADTQSRAQGRRVAIVLGVEPEDGAVVAVDSNQLASLEPLHRFRHLPNVPTAALAMELGATGAALTFVNGRVSGLQAIAEGRRLIDCHDADIVICGAVDGRGERVRQRHECPHHRTVGDCAAAVILEATDFAVERRALPVQLVNSIHPSTDDPPVAIVRDGWASCCDCIAAAAAFGWSLGRATVFGSISRNLHGLGVVAALAGCGVVAAFMRNLQSASDRVCGHPQSCALIVSRNCEGRPIAIALRRAAQ